MKKQKLRITAIEDNQKRFAVVFMNQKVAVAFDRIAVLRSETIL